eukprot:scpid29561/ scgid1398/ 
MAPDSLRIVLLATVSAAIGLWSLGEACDELVPEQCLLPFPNSFYLRADNSTDTGYRVSFSKEDFPRDTLGSHALPSVLNSFDGFSPFPSILAYFKDLSESNLPPHWDIAQSLLSHSPTILLNADTGERVPHFAELDNGDKLTVEHALMLWPAYRLNDNTRYIVAMRNLSTTHHKPVESSQTFLALRNGKYGDVLASNPSTDDDRQAHFDDIFRILVKAGVARDSLQLAWDFRTASRKCITERLVFTRDDAFERIVNICPDYTISKVTDNYSANIFRHIEGTFKVPYYTNKPGPGSHLVIDEKGLPVFQGVAEAEFEVLIPHSVVANATFTPPSPGRILQYGHGLFGSHDEVQQGYLQQVANRYGYVMAACTWWGMSRDDVVPLVLTLASNVSKMNILPDRLTQGVTNALLLMKLMKGSFSRDSHVQFGGSGKACYETDEAYYYGNSLGGIIGSVYMAATTDVTRGTIGVGGGPFGLLLPRSHDFAQFSAGLRALYPRSMDYISALSFLNMMWSRYDRGVITLRHHHTLISIIIMMPQYTLMSISAVCHMFQSLN